MCVGGGRVKTLPVSDEQVANDSSVFPLKQAGKKLRRIPTLLVRIGAVYDLTGQFLQVIICPAGEN